VILYLLLFTLGYYVEYKPRMEAFLFTNQGGEPCFVTQKQIQHLFYKDIVYFIEIKTY